MKSRRGGEAVKEGEKSKGSGGRVEEASKACGLIQGVEGWRKP